MANNFDTPEPAPAPEVKEDAELFRMYLERSNALFIERNNLYHSQFRKEGLGTVFSWIRTKMQRIAGILRGDITDDDEGLTENFLDLAIYGLLAAMLTESSDKVSHCTHLLAENPEGGFNCVLCNAHLDGTIT